MGLNLLPVCMKIRELGILNTINDSYMWFPAGGGTYTIVSIFSARTDIG